ncbi:transcriptional regulator [Novosphingobium aquae]|uniref:YdaS family helix-turn-helix protein n=1 Tax=Novosphingobium aquae TaxID=3133435 RepID=A0ABU8S3X4_9SPHN
MSLVLTPYEALEAAVKAMGSQQALADLCKVSQTAVWKWLQSSKRLPAEHVLLVEGATSVSRHWLRPDIYPMGLPATGDRFYGIDRRVAGLR